MPKLKPIKSAYIDAEKRPKPLESIECDAVLLCNWTAANDVKNNPGNAPESDSPTNEEIYWGAGANCVNQLFPGNSTILIPVSNLDELYVRCSQEIEGKRVYYTIFGEV